LIYNLLEQQVNQQTHRHMCSHAELYYTSLVSLRKSSQWQLIFLFLLYSLCWVFYSKMITLRISLTISEKFSVILLYCLLLLFNVHYIKQKLNKKRKKKKIN